jgi:hypothetical protein
MPTGHADHLPRYKQIRKVGLAFNQLLVRSMTKDEIETGAKKLGLFRNNTLVLDTVDESSVLMDYCLHDVRTHGVSPIERFLATSPPPADSDEFVFLQALLTAYFSLFAVESIERGVGVQTRDLLREESTFITDIGFGSMALPGMVLASRVFAPERIVMTTGAGLPVGELRPAQQAELVAGVRTKFPRMDFRNPTPSDTGELATFLIRGCLDRGAANRIAYLEPGQSSPHAPPLDSRPPAGRNDPCPCGSGKKYKKCCGG